MLKKSLACFLFIISIVFALEIEVSGTNRTVAILNETSIEKIIFFDNSNITAKTLQLVDKSHVFNETPFIPYEIYDFRVNIPQRYFKGATFYFHIDTNKLENTTGKDVTFLKLDKALGTWVWFSMPTTFVSASDNLFNYKGVVDDMGIVAIGFVDRKEQNNQTTNPLNTTAQKRQNPQQDWSWFFYASLGFLIVTLMLSYKSIRKKRQKEIDEAET